MSDPTTAGNGGGGLLPAHLDELAASGITPADAAAAGLYSEADPAAVARLLNWEKPAGRLGPVLVFPYPDAAGRPTGYCRLKPTCPRTDARKPGKLVKYEAPRGQPNRAYFPPGTSGVLADPAADLVITEGEKKALAAAAAGFRCVSVPGVWCWRRTRPRGAAGSGELLPELAAVAWAGRRASVVFDSDAAINPKVGKAERALVQTLSDAGAEARVVRLPPGPGGAKVGLDDYLVAHGADALRALLDGPAGPAPSPGPDPKDGGAGVFNDPAELDRLAELLVGDAAAFAAYKAWFKRERGGSVRDLEKALKDRADRLRAVRAERRREAAGPADGGPYLVRGGVTVRVVPTRDGPVEVPLADFTAVITAETARDDGAERTRCFTVEGRRPDGRPLPPIDVPADQFPGMNWVTAGWGNRAVVYAGQGTRDHLRVAIQTLSGDPPERVVYTHTGWRQLGRDWAYLHAGGAVGAAGPAPGVAVDLGPALAGYALPDPPTGADLAAAVRAVLQLLDGLATDRLTVPLLALPFRAALGGAPDFAVHLSGPTGSFKSATAALAQGCHGPALDDRHFPANWSGTPNHIEGVAFTLKDALCVVDDFNPTGAADPQKLHAAADRVFRNAGNGAGRGRLNADLSARPPRPPRGLLLSTGEDTPRGHSVRARLLVVEVEPGDVDRAALSRCQADARAGLYAAALAGFVRWLAPDYGAVLTRLPAERAAGRDRFAADAPHARTPAAAGDLMLGLRYLLLFARAAGAATAAEADALLDRARAALMGLVAAQTDHLRAGDPVEQFLRLLPAVLLSGQAHLAAPGGDRPDRPDASGWRCDGGAWSARGDRIGWADGDFVYLEPDAAYAAVQRLAGVQREALSMSQRTLWKRTHERGLLAEVDGRGDKVRFAVRKTFGGDTRPVVVLSAGLVFPQAGSGRSGRPGDGPGTGGHSGHSPAPDPGPARRYGSDDRPHAGWGAR